MRIKSERRANLVKRIRINDETVEVRDAEELAEKVRAYARSRGITRFMVQTYPSFNYLSSEGLAKLGSVEHIEAIRVTRYFQGA
jgi:hypothetical protein